MGNSELAAHLKESPNATYLSPNIQNELITLIGEEIYQVFLLKLNILLALHRSKAFYNI